MRLRARRATRWGHRALPITTNDYRLTNHTKNETTKMEQLMSTINEIKRSDDGTKAVIAIYLFANLAVLAVWAIVGAIFR